MEIEKFDQGNFETEHLCVRRRSRDLAGVLLKSEVESMGHTPN